MSFDSGSALRVMERARLLKTIEHGPFAERCSALREFYANANLDICKAGRKEWGIDPYEVDWMSVFTPIEACLWSDIREVDAVLYPQYPVGRYFVDFGNPVARVAIECDGAAYHRDELKDAARQRAICGMGWHIYRLSGRLCKQNFDEATMTSSVAHELIHRIAMHHALRRA